MKLLLDNDILIDAPNIIPAYSLGTIVHIDDVDEYAVVAIRVAQSLQDDMTITETEYEIKNTDTNEMIVVSENEIISYIPSTNELSGEYYDNEEKYKDE